MTSTNQKPLDISTARAYSAGDTDPRYDSTITSLCLPQKHPECKFSSENPAAKLFSHKKVKLTVFDHSIPKLTLDRYRDLRELLDGPLSDYIGPESLRHDAVSIKLKLAGVKEDNPKPYLIVLCGEDVSPKVIKFFRQSHIKQEYKPGGDDPTLPSFEVAVFEIPPQSKATSLAGVLHVASTWSDPGSFVHTMRDSYRHTGGQ
ncbi:hypothetical protein AJ79_08039 [Helicocarpus griseus UAMH5409]|uniref:Uncharacterized protein n=1 Tax=Helicocarpus griseus UAMH5409 TaxID=1447875 RepID=A0A2B7WWV1_9EURO|nr:hypothetical protein AJ79_08039 [Helicocarpus griseus UAMH5409]